jgi:hypothetical protein
MWRRAGGWVATLVIGTGLGALAGAGPAAAGGWAVTVLDPLPGRIVAGQAYDVGFWVVQHGSHPYDWGEPPSIGTVGLTLADGDGATLSFTGRALAEPAHYATTVTVPHDGSWRVTGVQGVFMDFHVGTLTVPGGLAPLGVPAAPSPEDMRRYWPGRVRPPVLPIDRNRDPFEEPAPGGTDQAAAQPPAASPAGGADPAAEPAADGGRRVPMPALVVAGVALALAAGVAGRAGLGRRLSARPKGAAR